MTCLHTMQWETGSSSDHRIIPREGLIMMKDIWTITTFIHKCRCLSICLSVLRSSNQVHARTDNGNLHTQESSATSNVVKFMIDGYSIQIHVYTLAYCTKVALPNVHTSRMTYVVKIAVMNQDSILYSRYTRRLSFDSVEGVFCHSALSLLVHKLWNTRNQHDHRFMSPFLLVALVD